MKIKFAKVEDHVGGLFKLTFVVEEDRQKLYPLIEKTKQGEWEVDVKELARKRSLDTNAMYWSVVTKIAKVLRTSIPSVHNSMIRKYGQPEMFDGKMVYVMIPDTEEASRKADEDTEVHLMPTSSTKDGKDGVRYRTYILMRGSSTYDSKEFSFLLDGALSEAKEIGLE